MTVFYGKSFLNVQSFLDTSVVVPWVCLTSCFSQMFHIRINWCHPVPSTRRTSIVNPSSFPCTEFSSISARKPSLSCVPTAPVPSAIVCSSCLLDFDSCSVRSPWSQDNFLTCPEAFLCQSFHACPFLCHFLHSWLWFCLFCCLWLATLIFVYLEFNSACLRLWYTVFICP